MTYKRALNHSFIKIEDGGRIHFINYDEERVLKVGLEDSILLRSYFDTSSFEELIKDITTTYNTSREEIKIHFEILIESLVEKGVLK